MPIAFQSATTATGNNGGNNAATVTINVPAGTVNGDMLILGVVVSEAAGVAPTCAGWTQKATHNGVQDGAGPPPYDADLTTTLFYRRASSEPASYNVLTDGTYGNYAALAMLRYTGVISAGDPFRTSATVSRTNANPFSASQTSATLSGVQATDMALHLSGTAMGGWNTNAYDLAGPGGGWTERGEVYMTTNSTGKPAVLFLEQLGTGTAPVITGTGTAVTASNVYWVFAAGALMAEPVAAAKNARVTTTAVRRASTW
ncbi:hypothetical protein ACIP79_00485 [Streptomyces sp. NPDC088747]|uniref:hypothetical protein n=1 Tax=Streptomyces sp. NPDC088747 TaxID=3365886 RepID=UPI00381BCBAD